MLKEIKVWPARIIECHNFAVHYRVFRQLFEAFGDVRILVVEVLSPSGIQDDFALRVGCYRAISVKLDFVNPIRTFRYFRNGKAFHGFHERSFASGQRLDVSHRRRCYTMPKSNGEGKANMIPCRYASPIVSCVN
jgi:hypothetical protein